MPEVESAQSPAAPYVQLFYDELAKRQISPLIKQNDLEFVFFDTQEPNTGLANGKLIGLNKRYWFELSEDQKQFVVFHELGHSVLGRVHLNEELKNHEWKSIMRGQPIPENKTYGVRFTGFRKNYYLDELFDVRTLPPNWVDSTHQPLLIQDTLSIIYLYPGQVNQTRLDLNNDFEITYCANYTGKSDLEKGILWYDAECRDLKNAFVLKSNFVKIYRNQLAEHDDFGYKSPFVKEGLNKLVVQKIKNQIYYYLNDQFMFFHEITDRDSWILKFTSSIEKDEKARIIIF